MTGRIGREFVWRTATGEARGIALREYPEHDLMGFGLACGGIAFANVRQVTMVEGSTIEATQALNSAWTSALDRRRPGVQQYVLAMVGGASYARPARRTDADVTTDFTGREYVLRERRFAGVRAVVLAAGEHEGGVTWLQLGLPNGQILWRALGECQAVQGQSTWTDQQRHQWAAAQASEIADGSNFALYLGSEPYKLVERKRREDAQLADWRANAAARQAEQQQKTQALLRNLDHRDNVRRELHRIIKH